MRLFDAQDLAAIFGVSVGTIYYRAKVGLLPSPTIPADRFGRRLRHLWTVHQLNRFFGV